MVNNANIEQEKVRCKFLTDYFNHMVNLLVKQMCKQVLNKKSHKAIFITN